MTRFILVFVLLIFFPIEQLLSQKKLLIHLKPVYEYSGLKTMTTIYDSNDFNYDVARSFKGIPTEIREHAIKILDFQPQQGLFELYLRLNGDMPKDALNEGLKSFGLSLGDTAQLSRQPINHFIFFLIGIDNLGRKFVIGDANNNYNFKDDKIYVFDSSGTKNLFSTLKNNVIEFSCQFAVREKIISKKIFLSISPFTDPTYNYVDQNEKKYNLITYFMEMRKGIGVIDKDSLQVKIISDLTISPLYSSRNTKIFINEKELFYSIGDTIYIKKKKFLLNHITSDGMLLELFYVGISDSIYGNNLNDFAFNFSGTYNNKEFELSDFRGRYVLVDFWGSWCKPCLEKIPDLINISQDFDQLRVISIAEEYGDYHNAKKIISDKKMNWINLFEQLNDTSKNSIAKRYKIESYPTQILISPSGRVLFRSSYRNELTKDSIKKLIE
ncbi:MAG TPA: TlpA disulfide reductase family protein [Parafilimonas sp.]|nr:TlpA disulfide reductase family protein [Parafilimonas sp.]